MNYMMDPREHVRQTHAKQTDVVRQVIDRAQVGDLLQMTTLHDNGSSEVFYGRLKSLTVDSITVDVMRHVTLTSYLPVGKTRIYVSGFPGDRLIGAHIVIEE